MKPSLPSTCFLVLTASSCVQAFAPPHSASRSDGTGKTFTQHVPHPAMISSTSLAMGGGNLLDRFVRVMNANVNKVVSSLEDPEKVIVQAVQDMQNDLIQIRRSYSETIASQRRLQSQKDQVDAEADDWYNRANLALQRGRENLAREALSRRQLFLDKSRDLETQLATQQAASDKLYAAMMALDGKIKEATSQKEQLIARARTAKSMQQVNEMLSGLGTGQNAMAAFTRMQEKVEALEAAAEVSTDLTLLPDMSLESEFLLLEQSSEIENELLKMKADLKLLGPSTSVTNENMPSTSLGRSSKTVQRIPVTSGRM